MPISASGHAPSCGRTYQIAAASAARPMSSAGHSRAASDELPSAARRTRVSVAKLLRSYIAGQRRLGHPAQVLPRDVEGGLDAFPAVEALEEGQNRARPEGPLAEGALLPVFQPLGWQVRVVQHRRAVHVDLFP